MQILLSRTQAGSGRTGKQEQEQTSCNHVPSFSPISVYDIFIATVGGLIKVIYLANLIGESERANNIAFLSNFVDIQTF